MAKPTISRTGEINMAEKDKAIRKAARAGKAGVKAGVKAGGKAARKSPRELIEDGKPEEAVIAQLRRIERNPEQGAAYANTLPLLVKLKLPRLAGMIGQKALSAGVTNAAVYVWLARAKRAEGDREGALSTITSGLAANPENQQLQKFKARLEGSLPEGQTAG